MLELDARDPHNFMPSGLPTYPPCCQGGLRDGGGGSFSPLLRKPAHILDLVLLWKSDSMQHSQCQGKVHNFLPLCRCLWSLTEHPWTTGCGIFSESYGQQLSDFDFQSMVSKVYFCIFKALPVYCTIPSYTFPPM